MFITPLPHTHTHTKITVTKSPLCGSESVVITVEDKGPVVDWMATGKQFAHAW